MRKDLIRAMLAVSALALSMPAVAQDWRQGRGGERHGDARPGTGEQRDAAAPARAPAPEQAQGRRGDGGGRNWDRQRSDGGGRNWDRQRGGTINAAPAPAPVPRANVDRRDRSDRGQWRQNDGGAQRQWQGRDRRDGQIDNRWQGRERTRDTVRGNVQGRNWSNDDRRRLDRDRWSNQRRWDRDWRQDNRYNWSHYRQYNRNVYRLPRYAVPYGWSYGYRSFSIGAYLDSLLFSNDYWIDDPWFYRLPPAYGSLRWIRYYDDALLVDTRDGYIVDVIRNVFWR